jgi:hypothetical protein
MGVRTASHSEVPAPAAGGTASATLLKRPATHYDLGIDRDVRRAVNTSGQEIIAFECTTMMEADLAVRSAVATALPEDHEGMHGALIQLRSTLDGKTSTVAILGASGAGKSHIIARFLADPDYHVRVVAEDWFVACCETRRAHAFREHRILLKRETAALYAGDGRPQEPSHTLASDETRGLYDAGRLFGDGGGRWDEEVVIDHLVVLRSEDTAGPHVRKLVAGDTDWIRAGEYSAYYQANERLLDGSTEVFTAEQIDRRVENLRRLARRSSAFVFSGSRALDGHAALRSIVASS